jgi:hypothetical protein
VKEEQKKKAAEAAKPEADRLAAEKKAKDLRNSKRQSDIAGRRTKLREQLQTPSLVSDSPREI